MADLTPFEALRRARATMACDLSKDDEGAKTYTELWDLAVDGHFDLPDGVGTRERGHARAASAILDGFSVDEITEAGG